MKHASLFLMATCISFLSLAQVSSVAEYNFDNLTLIENSGNYAAGQVIGDLAFDCGIGENSEALLMDGGPDTISLDPALKDLFLNDFSLSFFFWIDPEPGEVHSIFSIQNQCSADSALTIKYLTSLNQVRIEFARDISQSVFFSSDLDISTCWHHLVFTKNDDIYSFYLDGEFKGSVTFVDQVVLSEDAQVLIGSSPCIPQFETYYKGRIDQIEIFNQAIDDQLIASLDRFADRIISQDTTIFEGDEIQIFTGPSCASNINWNPTQNINDPSSADPLVSPTASTAYAVSFDHGICTSYDTILVNVLDENSIDCANILLPNAFTPNGDNLNDRIGISNSFIVADLIRFDIFDRWGAKLYETVNKTDGWDGRYQGTYVMPGTYVYKLEYSCKDVIYKKTGSFNLIR